MAHEVEKRAALTKAQVEHDLEITAIEYFNDLEIASVRKRLDEVHSKELL